MGNFHLTQALRHAFVGALAIILITGSAVAPKPAHALPAEAAPTQAGVLSFSASSPTGTNWLAPDGVYSIDVTIVSATGGASGFTGGGAATEAHFTMNVTPGDQLTLFGSTAGGHPKTRDAGAGYHNGGRGGDKSEPAAVGAGGAGSSALLRNGTLVAEVGGGGGAGGESNNRCKNCGPYGNKNLGGAGGSAGTDGAPGTGSIAGKPGHANQRTQGNGANGSSAATLSQGGGGGGGGGGFSGGNGGGAGRSALGTGSGGGGAGGSSWYQSDLFGLTEKTLLTGTDPGYVTITYNSATRTTVSAPKQVAAGTPFDVLVFVTNLNIPGLVPTGNIVITQNNETPLVNLPITGRETQVTIPALEAGTHTFLAYFDPADLSRTSARPFTVEVTPPTDAPILGDPTTSTSTTVSTGSGARYGTPTTVSAQVTPALLGATPTGTVRFSLNGVEQTLAATLDGSGTATATLPATLNAGTYQLRASYSGDATLSPSSSDPVELMVQRATTVATVTPDTQSLVFGTPITITLTATAPTGQVQPDGVIGLMTNEGLLRLAELTNGSATLTDVILPVGTTELYASYAGDETGNFAESVSDPAVPVSVTTAPSTTTLAATPISAMAGHGHEFTATVTTGNATGLDPRGFIEMVLDGEVIDTASVGSDSDTRLNDGVARYTLSTDQVPNGTHRVTARFVPSSGFAASESEAVTVTTVPWQTEVRASLISDAATPTVSVRVETQRPADLQGEGETPIAWGVVQAFRGESPVSDPVEVGDETVQLLLRTLPPGSHEITLRYIPERTVTLPSETTVQVSVPAGSAAAPSDASSGAPNAGGSSSQTAVSSLASTGGDASQSWWIMASSALLLLAAGVVCAARRRSGRPGAMTPEA